jgi:hypothetical protein
VIQICWFRRYEYSESLDVVYLHIIPEKTLNLGKFDASLEIQAEGDRNDGGSGEWSGSISALGFDISLGNIFLASNRHDDEEAMRDRWENGAGHDEGVEFYENEADFERAFDAACVAGKFVRISQDGFEHLKYIKDNWKKIAAVSSDRHVAERLASEVFAALMCASNQRGRGEEEVATIKTYLEAASRYRDLARIEGGLALPFRTYAAGETMPEKLAEVLGSTIEQENFSLNWIPILQELLADEENFEENFEVHTRIVSLGYDARHAIIAANALNMPLRYLREKFRGSRVALSRPETAEMPLKFYARGDEKSDKFIFVRAREYRQARSWLQLAEIVYREFHALCTVDTYKKRDDTEMTPQGWDRITTMDSLKAVSRQYGWCAGVNTYYTKAFKDWAEFYVVPPGDEYNGHNVPILAMYNPETGECEEAKTPYNRIDVTDDMPNLHELEETDEE